MKIGFHSEDVNFRLRQIRLTREWLAAIAKENNTAVESISYIFCSDPYLLEINRKYLGHDYFTDIITFPYQSDPVVSDIFISIDRVRDNARSFKTGVQNELRRVLAHGLLHLCGLKDSTENEKKEMRRAEEQALMMWKRMT